MENGYAKDRAGRVSNVLYSTAEREQSEKYRGLSAIRCLGFAGMSPHDNSDDRALDLRGVYERLVAGELRREVWGWVRGRASKGDVNFLIHMVNEYQQLDSRLAFAEQGAGSDSHTKRRRVNWEPRGFA